MHLLFGVAGLALARTYEGARGFLLGGGTIYLVLFLYGAVWGADEAGANWIPVNWADNILHLALGAGMILVGLALSRDVVRRDQAAPA